MAVELPKNEKISRENNGGRKGIASAMRRRRAMRGGSNNYK